MKFNKKCVKSMYGFFCALILVLFAFSCSRESAYSELITKEYPELYRYVFERNADSILIFTNHRKPHIRQQAWRALISTPVEDIDELITQVQYADVPVAWSALSSKELNNGQLTRLHDLWDRRASLRNGISLVLGKQGNKETLNFLARNFEHIIDSDYEYQTALAIGRLMAEHELSDVSERSILRYAAVTDNVELFQAYFYGMYRGNHVLEDEDMQKAIRETYDWTKSPKVKQYSLRILFNSDAKETFEWLNIEHVSGMNVQLAVELAQHTGKLDWSGKLENLYAGLLEHSNPVVNEMALRQIKNHPGKKTAFDEVMERKIVLNEDKEASVRLSGIEALSEILGYLELTDTISGRNEYFLIKKFSIYEQASNPNEYLAMLTGYSQSENRMEVLFAAQALSRWWNELEENQKSSSLKDSVRRLMFELLKKADRSITYVTVSLMQSSGLITSLDFSQIKSSLTAYKLPEDVEVYQVFGGFLKELFEDQAKLLIDSLVQKENFALNNTFRSQGWDIPEMEQRSQVFRNPDWQRLAELEYEPTWVLETEKGIIKVAMDVLSAPATISGLDSLTRAGAYDGVAFHRVVPNFVIQGGDVESGDGFGGPDYVVPTEASEKQYKRGMVGIASAGTDTEGSQYFVMHQWAPHLNGRYTVIGEVTEGIEVADRILVGDKVVKAYWQGH